MRRGAEAEAESSLGQWVVIGEREGETGSVGDRGQGETEERDGSTAAKAAFLDVGDGHLGRRRWRAR